jgi:uncharacterized protein YecT (DUF1311 family)
LQRDDAEKQAFAEGCDKNQTNMNICSTYDFKALDAQLNAAYRRQLARLKGTPYAARFVRAQKAWLAYVEADCLYQNGPREDSGSIWALQQNSCKSDHFVERIKLIKVFLDCTDNGCPGQ